MKFAVVASKKDIAGMNIASFVKSLPKYFFDDEIIFAEQEDEFWKNVKEDFIIFASKHQGKTPKMLSVHAPGNWRKNDYGGVEGKVCLTSASALKAFFQNLNKNIPQGWQATMECTHHGPLIDKPCLFIEIGSSKDDWPDKTAAETVAKAIEDSVNEIKDFETLIAIGGPHYCPTFNKIQLQSKFAISHVIPEYALPLTREMLQEAIKKTSEKVSAVVLDWKGIGKSEQRQEIIKIIEELGLKHFRTNEIEK